MKFFKYFPLCLLISCFSKKQDVVLTTNIYEFKIQSLVNDSFIDFSLYKGKFILIVNVASKCGYTFQYQDLQKLYQTYKDDLVIIGVPCNQFLFQEPGNNNEIQQFCTTNYGVTFPMTTKLNVKGDSIHPLYYFLTKKSCNGFNDYNVTWNFNKFLIDKKGKLIACFGSKTLPLDTAITRYIK